MDEALVVPPSENTSIALLSKERACIINSYETQVVCGDREWRTPEFYGSEGEGPEQFRRPAALMRIAPDTLGVVDIALQRLTILPGAKTVRIPPLFRPLTSVDEDTVIAGLYEAFSRDRTTARVAWLSLSADSLVARAAYRYQPEDWPDPPIFIGGARVGKTDVVFNISNRVLVRYRMDGTLIQEFELVEREPVYPSEEEVRRRAEDLRRAFGRPVPPQEIEEMARTPEPPFLPVSPVLVGPSTFIFVGSSRDRESHSYLDVFREGRQVGTIRVRDRVLSFDILGDVLATLVERTGKVDEEGLTPRGIDWYEIVVR